MFCTEPPSPKLPLDVAGLPVAPNIPTSTSTSFPAVGCTPSLRNGAVTHYAIVVLEVSEGTVQPNG